MLAGTTIDDNDNFWSSIASDHSESQEFLVYKLKGPLCAVHEVQIAACRAAFQHGCAHVASTTSGTPAQQRASVFISKDKVPSSDMRLHMAGQGTASCDHNVLLVCICNSCAQVCKQAADLFAQRAGSLCSLPSMCSSKWDIRLARCGRWDLRSPWRRTMGCSAFRCLQTAMAAWQVRSLLSAACSDR